MRVAVLALALGGCLHMGPHTNEVVAATGRKVAWRVPVASATFCSTCGRGAPTTITFGAPGKLSLVINSCYAHAHSKIGDHDAVSVIRVEDQAPATVGELDITDCDSKHVVATLAASFADGQHVDAIIDTPLTSP